MVKIFRILLLYILFFSINNFAQTINVSASTDTSDYLIGDYIYFKITVEFGEGIRIAPPKLTDQLAPLEVIKSLPATQEEDKNVQTFNYILSGYDSSAVTIPPIPITYFSGNNTEPQIINSNEVQIFIHTLEVNPAGEIKDVKAPIRIPFDWLFWSIVILILLLLAAVGYFLYRKYRKSKEEVREIRRVPALPLHILTLQKLDKLKEKKLWQQGLVKEFHSEITEIIRRYFEDRYNFNSLEMTTSQTVQILNRVMDNQKMIETSQSFLENADMVKFAKFVPLPSVNDEMMNQAYDIVQKTKKEEDFQMGVSRVQ
ncbi:MAG: hypothetical protein IPH62_03590 [Ignavibacteriae bacterium]|nr:hypothetical protein [Ignavibacteriota bacterium]